MAIHNKKHPLNSVADHAIGTVPSVGEINLIGTSSASVLAEATVEAPNTVTFQVGKVVVRSTDGQIKGVLAPVADEDLTSKKYVLDLINSGPWKAQVHSVVVDHTAATVGDGVTGVPLTVGSRVINTTDKKIYTVTSIAGGQTGATVTWNAGVLPTSLEIRSATNPEQIWEYDVENNTWVNSGATSHARSHAMTGTGDHTAGNWKVFFSNNLGQVTELALGAQYKPLLSNGIAANPVFGSIGAYPTMLNAAGDEPVSTDVSTVPNDCCGWIISTTGRMFHFVKTATNSYFCEYGTPAV